MYIPIALYTLLFKIYYLRAIIDLTYGLEEVYRGEHTKKTLMGKGVEVFSPVK